MKTRAITGSLILAFYFALMALTIYVNKFFYDIFVLLLMVCGGFEVAKAVGHKFSKPLEVIVLVYAITGYLVFYIFNFVLNINSGFSIYFAMLGLMFLLCLIISMFSKKITMQNVISTTLVMIYPVTVLIYMLGLNYLPGDAGGMNIAAIMLMFMISTFTDTCAYLVGITFKGPKLCPSVSPKKTISGAIGGALGGVAGAGFVLLCSIYGWLRVPVLSASSGLNIVHYAVLGVVGAVFTQIGDLLASYFKRQCGIKDFGTLLPGHGGIMDRIDGFMLNAVFIYIYFVILSF